MEPMTEKTARAVYMILVRVCAASPAEGDHFVSCQTTGYEPEWRFCGELGFGGKLKRRSERLVVDCYPEDSNPKRKKIIEQANAELAQLTA